MRNDRTSLSIPHRSRLTERVPAVLFSSSHLRCHARTPYRASVNGFSLIELLIGIAMIGILFVLAIPSFSSWIANSQIRNSAEAISNGLQVARGEAIHRNALVRFCLPTATSWIVTVNEVTCSATPPAANIVQQWSAEEGSKTAQIAAAAGATTVTFNGLGRIAPNDDGSVSLRQMDFTSSVSSASEIRVMRVVIGVGGSVRMCDPNVAAGDPRAC